MTKVLCDLLCSALEADGVEGFVRKDAYKKKGDPGPKSFAVQVDDKAVLPPAARLIGETIDIDDERLIEEVKAELAALREVEYRGTVTVY